MPANRVLIVDDSVFMRKIISDLISEHPGYQVIGTAKNGREAVDMTEALKPDVITMDVEMPVMNGLEALQIIMKKHPTPVIMLSSLTRDGALETIQALEWGAVDFVRKPSGSISLDLFKVKEILYEKLDTAVKSKVSRGKPYAPAPPPPPKAPPAKAVPKQEAAPPKAGLRPTVPFKDLVAIGTSTGGPRALQQVLTRLPEHFPAPIVIVQHMPPGFTQSLALRLDSASRIRVTEGANGMVLEAGTAYIAPGGFHMTVVKEGTHYLLRTSKEEPRGGHRPCVDTLFESLLPLQELRRHIVIMTGMGSDGAKGMMALKQEGAATIAEAEETCVVYGMPRAAKELNCVDHLLPVHEIAGQLTRMLC